MAPSVEYLSQKYQGQDVVFLSVAGTQNGATAESTAGFIRQYQSTWTYVLDTDRSVFSEYRVDATPTFLIIDRSGVILSRLQGAIADGRIVERDRSRTFIRTRTIAAANRKFKNPSPCDFRLVK